MTRACRGRPFACHLFPCHLRRPADCEGPAFSARACEGWRLWLSRHCRGVEDGRPRESVDGPYAPRAPIGGRHKSRRRRARHRDSGVNRRSDHRVASLRQIGWSTPLPRRPARLPAERRPAQDSGFPLDCSWLPPAAYHGSNCSAYCLAIFVPKGAPAPQFLRVVHYCARNASFLAENSRILPVIRLKCQTCWSCRRGDGRPNHFDYTDVPRLGDLPSVEQKPYTGLEHLCGTVALGCAHGSHGRERLCHIEVFFSHHTHDRFKLTQPLGSIGVYFGGSSAP